MKPEAAPGRSIVVIINQNVVTTYSMIAIAVTRVAGAALCGTIECFTGSLRLVKPSAGNVLRSIRLTGSIDAAFP